MDYFFGMIWPGTLIWEMTDLRYYETPLQVPASEVPDDCTVAQRAFAIVRKGGMVQVSLGPVVPGPDGETYSVLLGTAHVQRVIATLEVILANMGR